MEQISITKPDDWHCHLRDGHFLARTVPDTVQRFARAIVMPNLHPPITQVKQALEYRERILSYVPSGASFQPLMTLYLTSDMKTSVISEAKTSGAIVACKLYPSGATTHSAAGVAQLSDIYPLLEQMETLDLPLLIHGESIDPAVDIFDREQRFIEKDLVPLLRRFPALRVVLEHISTREAVDFVRESASPLGATITAHHLWYHRNALLAGGLRPHYYCMPILKRRADQEALINAATSGHPKFFLGTDSAPHSQSQKESACGCAGVYTAHAGIELYTQIFAEHQALEHLEKFASLNGAQFYRLPVNKERITLKKVNWDIPKQLPFGDTQVIPMRAGETLDWSLEVK